MRGSGVEIRALHLPMLLPAGVRVRYVDPMTVPKLRAHYPELDGQDLAPVDVVDDGELLSTVEAESVDFIIANHFLEHCEDPIRTIETHLGKLRQGGVLFYAVPDKRYTFDFRRPRTPFRHLIADHEDGGKASRGERNLEYAQLVYPEGGQPSDEPAARELSAAGRGHGLLDPFSRLDPGGPARADAALPGATGIVRDRGGPARGAGEHRGVARAR
jgi:SAM-dependent methyltransferase